MHRAAFAAARMHGPGGKPTPSIVLGYRGVEDRWSALSEEWWAHVDTSAHWETKQEALRAYGTQMRASGPRSVEQVRLIDAAAGSSLAVDHAETFVPYRLAY
ncbi:hypothetical protein [Kutzneria kofuensis]|uniref:hypothetical protein n=1 Tax=Kutzneria kofuensis TaxID=103725 RepID=UPI0031E78F6F